MANFTTNELKLIEEATENYGSRCSDNEWRELLYKIRMVQSKIDYSDASFDRG